MSTRTTPSRCKTQPRLASRGLRQGTNSCPHLAGPLNRDRRGTWPIGGMQPLGTPSPLKPPASSLPPQAFSRLFGFSPEGDTSLPLVRKPPDLVSPPSLKPKRCILAGLVKFLAVGCGLNENYFLANFMSIGSVCDLASLARGLCFERNAPQLTTGSGLGCLREIV
jgi:hypothetical protein